ncbi:MAG: hypothetical protein ACREFO_12970 [Acetobacteraceae bacterium]
MTARKFAIGDRVRLAADIRSANNPHEVYTISRMLPALSNDWQYRMKRVGDGQERAAIEAQLVKVASNEWPGRAEIEERRGRSAVRGVSTLELPPGGSRRAERGRR